MPQSLTPLSSSNGSGAASALSAARAASPPPPSSPSASTGSRGSRSSRSKRGGSSVARRRFRRVLDNTQKHYAPHVCRFAPYRPPAAVMLDPFPSLRINGLCMAGLATLVTVHRSGVRLYRERHLSPPTTLAAPQQLTSSSASLQSLTTLRSAPATVTAATTTTAAPAAVLPRGVSTASGVFEQLEARCDFQVRESYLCSAMQPVLMDRAVLLSKWSRYFCVASGSDRVVHSVAVMSSGAHFCLHHERHQTNKVVCLHCTQVATEPFHPAVLKPAVASVDEVGSVVLFDVEREIPALLEKAPLWYRQVKGGEEGVRARGGGGDDDEATAAQPPRQSPLLDQQLSPEEEDHVLDVMERVPSKERATYHVDHGVATRVTLVGPCLELCNHCHNAFMSLATSRGYIMVSIYISSRARDVPNNDDATEGPGTGDGKHSSNHASAELNVVLLRVLWGPRRAFVLEEVRLVHEAAPTDVCEAGVATAARPYQVGLPSTLLLARPGLALWQLHACTGQRIDTRRIYPLPTAGGGKGIRNGGGVGGVAAALPRLASEFIIHWVPLGRHRLTMQQDDRIGPQSWFCIAAVTDDDTVLLLGRAPQSCRTSPSDTAPPLRPSPATSPKRVTEKFTDANLEGWLDDLSAAPPAPSPPAEASNASTTKDATTTTTTISTSETPYTVLMKLYSPSGTAAAAASVAAGVVSVMPDLHDNRLLLFMTDEEALLSVPLPFAERIATLTDSDPQPEEEKGRESGPSPTSPGVDLHAAAEAMASNGYSQYLWGATSAAVTAASQGWSSSVQRWAPTTSSYFPFSSGSGGGGGGVASSPLASSTPPAAGRGALRDAAHTPAPAVEQPYRPFSLARPLMAAVFHFAGEDSDPPNTQIAQNTLRPAANAAAATAMAREGAAGTTGGAFTPPPEVFAGVRPTSPVPVQLPSPHRRTSLEPRSTSEEASASVAATAVSTATTTTTATNIRVAHGDREWSGSRATSRDSRQSAHRRPHHRVPSSASLNEYGDESDGTSTRGGGRRRRRRQHHQQQRGRGSDLPAVLEVNGTFMAATQAGVEDGTAQASYIEQQMALLTQPQDQAGDNVSPSAGKGRGTAPRTLEEAQFMQRRLVDVEEPLERNMLLYSWKDGHNDLYIRLCVGLDALEQTAAAAAATKSPTASAKVRSPQAHRPASQVDALRLVTHTSADVAHGVHSVGFLETCHASTSWRTTTASYGNCFHFADYFARLQVPHHLLDLQERDKCRLELEDLRMQQVRDLAAVHPFAWMTICQNEERRSAEAEWRLHATFPYDEERDGRVVDINGLNRTASTHREAVAGAPAWRWATAKEARMWAEEEEGKGQHSTTTRRVQSLVRELKDWSVGPWEYAERWPPSHGKNTGSGGASFAAAFSWCPTEAPSHRCRRRRLTRLRVNVDELRRQAQLTETHIRELNALRDELGL